MRELTRNEVRGILEHRPEELTAVWPDIQGTPLTEVTSQHLDRDGFRFVAEEDAEGRLAGIAYGYAGAPGQWWHDRVAAEMTPEQQAVWLPPRHFELVELAVRPDLRRRGIGVRLLAAVLEGLEDRPALLSTQVTNEPALALYRSRGWEIVVPEVDFGWARFCILGRAPSGAAERVVA